jgi:putative NIF3 family GTP cyclohydrolase 1 type 2
MPDLSRREFAALAASAATAPFAFGRTSAAAAVTAQDLIDRIRKNIGVEWKLDSVDGVKAGDASTIVTGVATTSMATLSVLQQAVKTGANVVITAHPTFYARADARTPPAGRGAGGRGAGAPGADPTPSAPVPPPPKDPVFTGKDEFIARHKLVVFRLSDHWRQRQPDPRVQGLAATLGWTKFQSASDPMRFDVPTGTLDALARAVKDRLQSRGGIRVVGDPQARVSRVGLLPGSTPIQAALKLLPTVDVILAGDVREWESVEYARDSAFGGGKKGLILLGRVVSEEPGMNVCASWLKTFVPEVPVLHLRAGDPYWRPA